MTAVSMIWPKFLSLSVEYLPLFSSCIECWNDLPGRGLLSILFASLALKCLNKCLSGLFRSVVILVLIVIFLLCLLYAL